MLLLILLDLPSVFGTAGALGFHYVTFSWFSSHSSDSNFLVSIADSSSSVFPLNGSVPQQSPECSHLLFLFYTLYLENLIYSHVSHLHAGECQICIFRLDHSPELKICMLNDLLDINRSQNEIISLSTPPSSNPLFSGVTCLND